MALGAGIASDFLFPKRKFTSLLAINLLVMVIEIPLIAFGFFNIRAKDYQPSDLEMLLIGAFTDGYYYMFYMLGSLAIARQVYVCDRKCILGTVLGFVFGVANIMNVVLNESMLFFLGTNFTLISIFIVLTLALSTLCLLHMVYQELKYNRLVCTNEKRDKRYQ